MERGVGTGTRFEADALILSAGMSRREITERILCRADLADRAERADLRGLEGAALIDAADGTVTRWPRFARTVRAAAHGLGRRGVADGDAVGVLVPDAVSYATAVHAIRAAGATALGLRPDRDTAAIAAELNQCRARMLITAAPLARLATQAADRSWVRQVLAFGEAEGTTPFCSLLDAGPGSRPARPPGPAGELACAGGPDLSAGLAPGDVVVAVPPCGEGQAYMSLLDLALLAGATIVAAPVPQVAAALRRYRGCAAIVPQGTPVRGVRVFAVP